MVDLEALAGQSSMYEGLGEDEVADLIAEVRALRAERDGLAEQCELLKSISQQQLDLARADRLEAWKERDALRARVAELERLVSENDRTIAWLSKERDAAFTEETD